MNMSLIYLQLLTKKRHNVILVRRECTRQPIVLVLHKWSKKRSLHTEGNANVLCQQNKPVFSNVDLNQYIDVNYNTNKTFRLQELPKSSHSHKKSIHITTPGIVNQSQNINSSRATGPDHRQCRVLNTGG